MCSKPYCNRLDCQNCTSAAALAWSGPVYNVNAKLSSALSACMACHDEGLLLQNCCCEGRHLCCLARAPDPSVLWPDPASVVARAVVLAAHFSVLLRR